MRSAGEVVGTTSTELIAQSAHLHETPPLGALVRVKVDERLAIYAVVAGAATDGVSAGARPVLRGREGIEDAAIYRENPDLVHVLRTCFQCVVVGFCRDGAVCHFLPPTPAPIHYSVYLCGPDEVVEFTAALGYVQMLLTARDIPTEEVVAAHIREAAERRNPKAESAYDFTVRAGREVAALLREDHQRLATILQRIRRSPAL
ncbi:MAG: hypothetical protein QOF51_600 [Chloroflexota bacterium]|jgi:hypothetical protein|nr:hypothetical protein [Chloroflexota bacterium]